MTKKIIKITFATMLPDFSPTSLTIADNKRAGMAEKAQMLTRPQPKNKLAVNALTINSIYTNDKK